MAKKIFASERDIADFLSSAQARLINESSTLRNKRFQSDKEEVTFTFKLDSQSDERRAKLYISPKAWVKMYSLVLSYTSEVEWHGTVKRINETTFLIEDVLIFPHEVTGSTVISDQNEYEKWLNSLDDNTFNALRFHGHSHVNMGVSPSSVDTTYRKNVLNNFGTPTENSDYFYIFMITNKRQELNAEIYDLQNNALYGTAEISIDVLFDDDGTMNSFLNHSREVVKERSYSYQYSTPSYSSNASTTTQSNQNKTVELNNKPKKSAKVEAHQDSLFDKEDDADDWHKRVYGGMR